MGDWGYEKHNGPATWASKFLAAAGSKQSPIDIEPTTAQSNSKLLDVPLQWSYVPNKSLYLLNTGHGWKVNVDGEGSCLQGGPLNHKYQLAQFHCHWGKTDETGSEHTVVGVMHPGEIHLVHWNTELFQSFDEAVSNKKGLAVLGVFLQVGDEHVELRKLTSKMSQISYKGQTVPLIDGFDPSTLIPGDHAYWTYEGSLTTPPCYESVTWIVFKQPLQVSGQQLNQFRKLHSFGEGEVNPGGEFFGHIFENYRPPLPLGDRVLHTTPN
ncbi:carbonic anhydrase 2-like isoform X1 [Tachypleus tridentatus]|uniref:carbonic anhydrase 2-like isoform X1 n=1 Tax=Tachypleus tridentatus TaxID=6853 RepID=UPI003FD5AC0F